MDRRGIRFSDGHPFDADDVVFSYQVYMDEKVGSPQRDLLLPGGKPIVVRKVDQYTVEFQPTNRSTDLRYRKIRIDALNKDYRIGYRPGYYPR